MVETIGEVPPGDSLIVLYIVKYLRGMIDISVPLCVRAAYWRLHWN